MPRFSDIPTFPRASWCVDIGWDYLERFLDSQFEIGLDLEPDFQRAHVWTREQQIAYVEYQLRGGEVAREITCNAKDWSSGRVHDYVIVDGKQRLEAVRAFLRGDIPAFGHYRHEYTDRLRMTVVGLKWRVTELATREEVLELYLNINAGGTPHTKDELERVRSLLRAQRVTAKQRKPGEVSEERKDGTGKTE